MFSFSPSFPVGASRLPTKQQRRWSWFFFGLLAAFVFCPDPRPDPCLDSRLEDFNGVMNGLLGHSCRNNLNWRSGLELFG